jgi:cholest-4-en-3-one 26-monooxygenase
MRHRRRGWIAYEAAMLAGPVGHGRSPNQHLGFGGGGPHFCLGRHLAALELRALFTTLAARMPDIEPAGQPRRLRSNFVNGIKEMPVRFTPSRR